MSAEKQPPHPAANDERSALADLKSLLIGPEQASIDELQRSARDPEVQSERVAETLPQSLQRAYADSPETLTRALETPVSACLENSVRRNPGFFADILFPVMGPAIRRAISQSLKGLVQQINQTLEYSLTLKGLKWRLEAARSGVPFAEVVLRHTLRYRVEEAFLIQGGSGLLLQHASAHDGTAHDADAVSAMLTAIRDFTRDTLRDADDSARLETIDAGEHTLWLVHGPHAYLACAIRGVPPVTLRDDLSAVVEEIHQRHARLLEDFDGDEASALPLAPLVERCLQAELEERATRRFPWPLFLITALLVGLLGWWLYGLWQEGARERAHVAQLQDGIARLRAAPGIIVTDSRVDGDMLEVAGLHDPLMPSPRAVLAGDGIDDDATRLSFRPYQSLAPAAALARARQRLAPPATVELSLRDDGTLQASGTAPADWTERAGLLATTVPGIDAFDASALVDRDRELERQLRAALEPPPDVSIRVENGRATLEGTAPLAWITALRGTPPALPGLAALDSAALQPLEADRLAKLVAQIHAARVPFVHGSEFADEQQRNVDQIAVLAGEAYQHATDLGRDMRLQVIGRTDGTGSLDRNLAVAGQRAAQVAEALRRSDLPLPPLDLRAVTQPPAQDEPDITLRRVEFRVTGSAADAPASRP